MLTYATPEDLVAWPVTPMPADPDRYLRSGSLLVSRATRTAVYDVDEDGMPTGATADAFRDATCAQVATWAALGVDPAKGAADDGSQQAASKSIGGASIQYAVYASTAEARQQAAAQLCDEAATILQLAGLMGAAVRTSW